MDVYYQVKNRLRAPTLAGKLDISHWCSHGAGRTGGQISKEAILKTKNATIAFLSSPPFLIFALSLSPLLFLRYCDFWSFSGFKKSARC